MADYYELLGIAKDADEKAIKGAFRKLSLKYHPDRNPDDKSAEAKFKEINEAYQTLSDPAKRQQYDFGGVSNGAYNSPIEDILRNMGFGMNFDIGQNPFSGSNRSNRSNSQQKMQITQQVNISLKDAVFGCELDIKVPSYINCVDCKGSGGEKKACHKCGGAGQTSRFLGAMQYISKCVTCNGLGHVLISTCHSCNQDGFKKTTRSLKMKIPAGIQSQTALHINGDINERCDVFVIVNVIKHTTINRNGATLFSTEQISCLDAMVGGKINVETIDGVVELFVPPGTQQGSQLVIENRGGVLTNGRANHIVNAHISIPVLTEEQIKIIQSIKNP
jgi:molecular chaperone DnaJ